MWDTDGVRDVCPQTASGIGRAGRERHGPVSRAARSYAWAQSNSPARTPAMNAAHSVAVITRAPGRPRPDDTAITRPGCSAGGPEVIDCHFGTAARRAS